MELQSVRLASKATDYIEAHASDHTERLKQIIRIPSIAAENPEGVRECARLVQRWFRELGCVEAEIVETAGFPVVYGHYDAHARNTILVYMMYDVKQVQGENWTVIQDPSTRSSNPCLPSGKYWWAEAPSIPRVP